MVESRAGAPEGADAIEVTSGCLRQTPQASVVELLELLGVFWNARVQTNALVEQLQRENPKVPRELISIAGR